MAGFLDSNSSIIDVVLTSAGKKLYSRGELRFAYYAFMDDEVDYDPYIHNSGSLTAAALSASKVANIESTPVWEAATGRPGLGLDGRDCVNGQRLLFTMPQGQTVMPSMSLSPPDATASIEIGQRRVSDTYVKKDGKGEIVEIIGPIDRGFERTKSPVYVIDPSIDDFFDGRSSEGYRLEIFVSASHGLVPVEQGIDLDGARSYLRDLRAFFDEDQVITRSKK